MLIGKCGEISLAFSLGYLRSSTVCCSYLDISKARQWRTTGKRKWDCCFLKLKWKRNQLIASLGSQSSRKTGSLTIKWNVAWLFLNVVINHARRTFWKHLWEYTFSKIKNIPAYKIGCNSRSKRLFLFLFLLFIYKKRNYMEYNNVCFCPSNKAAASSSFKIWFHKHGCYELTFTTDTR